MPVSDLQLRLARLRQTQNADGGWGYFPGKQSWLEPTAYAALALAGETSADRAWTLLASWQGGDGSLRLVDLPGHADGHFGFVLQSADTRLFYIVDACWHVKVLLDKSPLPWISRRFQHDAAAYFATQDKLRQLTERTGIELIACHCPRTLQHVS